MTQLIGITGLARSGKDTFASLLVRQGYKRIAFADPLKEAVATIAGEPAYLYHDDFTKEEFSEVLGTTRRAAMQALGTDYVRNHLHPDVWIRRAVAHWRGSGCVPTVISDVRFDNEAQAIKDLGGIVVRMVRAGSGLTGPGASHPSEQGVSDNLVNVEIDNNGAVGELAPEALKLVKLLLSGSPRHQLPVDGAA